MKICTSAVKPHSHQVDPAATQERGQATHLARLGIIEGVERMSRWKRPLMVGCRDGANLDRDSRVIDFGHHVDLTGLDLHVAFDDSGTASDEEINRQVFG